MPKFIATLRLPELNKTTLETAIKSEMTRAVEEAARVWLNATAVALIPVWSGASLATFLHLARAVMFGLNVAPLPGVRDRRALGLNTSGPSQPISLGQNNQYLFTYQTTLRHLIFNEFNNANIVHDPHVFSRLLNPGPYNFQQSGQAAFQQFAATVRLPNPFRYLRVQTLRIQ